MHCLICDADTGDACVPLCEAHMPVAELAGAVEIAAYSDFLTTTVTHADMMCDRERYTRHDWQEQVSDILARCS